MMFGKPIKCHACGKESRRGYGFTFTRKVDKDCGDGWFCTRKERIHICNDCLDKLFFDLAAAPKSIRLDVDNQAVAKAALNQIAHNQIHTKEG